MKQALSYDDVLIVPDRSSVESRGDVSLESNVTPQISVDTPLISAPMDSVTGPDLAQEMADNGGVGIIHRVADWEDRRDWIEDIDGVVGASIGIESEDAQNAIEFADAGADFICVDVAHGHLEKAIDFVEHVTEAVDVEVMVGNIATWTGARDLVKAGADSIKIGVGPGALCSTREQTGVGVPQFTAVRQITNQYSRWQYDADVTFVADGGITKPGDATKALMAGADTVMMGSMFGVCESSPGDDIWGMASETSKEKQGVDGHIEGVHHEIDDVNKTVRDVFSNFEDGVRSGLSYVGGQDIEEARAGVQFVRTTATARMRNGGFAKDFY